MKINNLEYSIGNSKIGKDTIIINMGSAADCPSLKLGLCAHADKCYAMKSETQYPNVLPYRDRQAHYWLNNLAEEISIDINLALKKHKNIKWVRFNESGDFYGERCLEKLIKISTLINCPIYTYTSRRDLINNKTHLRLSDKLCINTSNFQVEGLNAFGQYNQSKVNCAMDCSICSICKIKRPVNINVPIH
jgi:hypothetical protein